MDTIYVAGGVGTAPTEMAAYDAALAGANLHNYNLVRVSSIIPDGTNIESVAEVPELGPAGNRLTVVESRATAEPGAAVETIVAGLGWATGPGPGIFYEAAGTDEEAVRDELETGLEAGAALRDWSLPNRDYALTTGTPTEEVWTTAVAVAAYGTGDSIH